MKVIIALCLICVATVYSFPTGAPITKCNDPYPSHGVDRSTEESPYTITASSSSYSPNDVITITVSADSNVIRGFSIGVHSKTGAWETLYGEFTATPEHSTPYQYYSESINCVTHGINFTTTNQTVFQWTAPGVSVGDLIISATLIRDYQNFWVGQNVALNAVQAAGNNVIIPAREVSSTVSDLDEDLSLDKCGEASGCLTIPENCGSDVECDIALSHKPVNGGIRFRLTSRQRDSSFVAMGISDDQMMTNDETVSCLKVGDNLVLNHGYNPSYFNVKAQTDQISDVVMWSVDGALICEFTRAAQGNFTYYGLSGAAQHTVDFNANLNSADNYLYIAWGSSYVGSKETAGKHSAAPAVSKSKIAFGSTARSPFNSQSGDSDDKDDIKNDGKNDDNSAGAQTFTSLLLTFTFALLCRV